jgi:hypothetical protein
MATIEKTTVRTPDSTLGSPDLCHGLPITDAPSAELGWSKTYTLLNSSPNLLEFKGDARIGVTLDFGICGPSWATYLNAEGTYDSSNVSLTISDEDTRAGLFAGAQITINFDLDFQYYHLSLPHCHVDAIHCHTDALHCNWHLHCHGGGTHCSGGTPHCSKIGDWRHLVKSSFGIPIDLVRLILSAIKAGLDKDNKYKDIIEATMDRYPKLGGLSMVARKHNGLKDASGDLKLDPNYPIQVNILDYLTAGVFDKLHEVDEKLKSWGGGVRVGPELVVALPTEIKLTKIRTDGNEYSPLSWNGATVSGPRAGGASTPSGTLDFEYEVSSTLDFKIGFFGGVRAFKVISISKRFDIDISKVLGIQIPTGTQKQTVSGTVGTVATRDESNQNDSQRTPYEVIFEDPKECHA